MRTLSSGQWSDIWARTDTKTADVRPAVQEETASVRCQKIIRYLKANLGEIAGKSTIEIGSGSGIYSLILAGLGANVTLFDYSADALKLAYHNFKLLGLKANFIQGDAFRLPLRSGPFDIAMSFGTVEHYRYPQRFEICQSHVDLLRSGGVAIISTPNLYFFPHELLKLALRMKGKWFLGYEGSFSRSEMHRMGKRLQLNNAQVIGSSFRCGLRRYKEIVRDTSTYRRWFRSTNTDKEINYFNGEQQAGQWLDDYIGQDIVLMGSKG